MMIHEKNETKARLPKDQVEILEAKFQENNKPNSQTKRSLAAEFGVEQARINVSVMSYDSMNEANNDKNWFQNRRARAKHERKQALNGSMNQDNLPYNDDSDSVDTFDESFSEVYHHGLPMGDMAQMPILSGPPAPVASYNPSYENASAASMNSLHRTLAVAEDALARGDFQDFGYQSADRAAFPIAQPHPVNADAHHLMASQVGNGFFMDVALPSQLLDASMQFQSNAMMPVSAASSTMTSPVTSEASFALNSIPGPSNIATRRSKRPANIGVDAVRGTTMGPRSYSSSDIPQPSARSPTDSPMRRVHSNQLGLNVISGRVQKTPLRSPMSKNFGINCENYLRDMPSTAGTVTYSRDFPPTPSSPFEKQLLAQSRASASASPVDASSFMYPGSFDVSESGSTMASPPETPLNPIVNNHWNFEALDQPLQTPNFEMFPNDMMSMPQFVSPSQPNTPAFGTYTGFGMVNEQPSFEIGKFDPNQLEYIFPGTELQFPKSRKSSPVSLGKTFTFNNITQESLKEQQRRSEEREKTPKSLRA